MGTHTSKILAILFVIFLLLVIYWAASGSMPGVVQRLYDFPGGDKAAHFLLVGGLALLVNLALGGRHLQIAERQIFTGSVLVAIFISLEEVSQFAFPLRTPDIWDWVASMAGIAFAGWLVRRIWLR